MGIPVLDRMEADPRFSKLTYATQVEIRYRVAAQELAKDEKFLSLQDRAKKQVLEAIAFRLPVFENPDVQKQMGSFSAKYIEGDKQTRRQAKGTVMDFYMNEGWTIQKLLNRHVWGPLYDLASKRTKVVPKLKPSFYEYHYGRDKRKTIAYLEYLSSQNSRERKGANIARTLGSFGGVAADLLTMYAATGMGGPTRALGVRMTERAAAARQAPKWVESAWKWISKGSSLPWWQSGPGQWMQRAASAIASSAV